MNTDRLQGNWMQFKGKIREKWGKLTNDDLDMINGKREQLVGRIQESYGIAQDEAEKQVKDFERIHACEWTDIAGTKRMP